MSFLVVTFPYSNVGLAQVMPGQNAECVCRGLKNVFERVGGVPTRIVFDNAAGVGRRADKAGRVRVAGRHFYSTDPALGGGRHVRPRAGGEVAPPPREAVQEGEVPQVKSFSGYDFSQASFPDGYTADDLMSLGFVGKAQDFVFHGKTGRGKTHLAIAVGAACVERGMQARFFTAAELVLLLLKAKSESRLDALMSDLSRADLLIIDEMGYVPLDVDGSRLLFQVMSDCYERRSMVITTNIEFSKWGAVFGDDKLAAAAVDRIMHHGRLVEFNGGSRRMDEALMLARRQDYPFVSLCPLLSKSCSGRGRFSFISVHP